MRGGGGRMKKKNFHAYYVRTFCVNINYIPTKGGKIEGEKRGEEIIGWENVKLEKKGGE
jgi:hypothetical protein